MAQRNYPALGEENTETNFFVRANQRLAREIAIGSRCFATRKSLMDESECKPDAELTWAISRSTESAWAISRNEDSRGG